MLCARCALPRKEERKEDSLREALRRYDASKSETALVGDQTFTDTLGANLAGITSLQVRSIHNHTVWLKLRHVFEVPFLAMSKKRRVTS